MSLGRFEVSKGSLNEEQICFFKAIKCVNEGFPSGLSDEHRGPATNI